MRVSGGLDGLRVCETASLRVLGGGRWAVGDGAASEFVASPAPPPPFPSPVHLKPKFLRCREVFRDEKRRRHRICVFVPSRLVTLNFQLYCHCQSDAYRSPPTNTAFICLFACLSVCLSASLVRHRRVLAISRLTRGGVMGLEWVARVLGLLFALSAALTTLKLVALSRER